jgi:hypothetical protein
MIINEAEKRITEIRGKKWHKKVRIVEIWATDRHTNNSFQSYGCGCEGDCPGYYWVDYHACESDPDSYYYGDKEEVIWVSEDNETLYISPDEEISRLEYQIAKSSEYKGPTTLQKLRKAGLQLSQIPEPTAC